MNLIGHYTCSATPVLAERLGSVLPDLTGLYRRKVRAHALRKAWNGDVGLPESVGLIAGMDFHHLVDSRFHHAPLFKDTAKAIQQALLDSSRTPGLKRFLPAHVLCELFIDHLLIVRDPELVDAFHGDLEAGSRVLATFVARHPQADASSFQEFLVRISTNRFVAGYRTLDGIFYRMNRILARYSQRPLEARETAAVTACLKGQAERIAERLDAFVHDMRGLRDLPLHRDPQLPRKADGGGRWVGALNTQPA